MLAHFAQLSYLYTVPSLETALVLLIEIAEFFLIIVITLILKQIVPTGASQYLGKGKEELTKLYFVPSTTRTQCSIKSVVFEPLLLSQFTSQGVHFLSCCNKKCT